MLKLQHEESESRRIQQEFVHFDGGSTTEEFSAYLLSIGFWSDEEIEKANIRWAQGKVRNALKECDELGLPYAIPSATKAKSGAPVWKQLDICSFEDVQLQVQQLDKQERGIRREKEELVRYAVKRWNRIPSVSSDESDESDEATA